MYVSLRVLIVFYILGVVNCRLFSFCCFISKSHLWVSTYDICLSSSRLPSSVSCFLDTSICTQISKCHYCFCCVVVSCINVPHFPYPFFSQGTFRLFPCLTLTNNPAKNIAEHMCLWYNWASFGHITRSAIAGSWDRLCPNF